MVIAVFTGSGNNLKNVFRRRNYLMDRGYLIRPVNVSDARAIADIYSYYVLHTIITFEFDAPGEKEIEHRIANVTANYPWFVCEIDDNVVGYTYASRFRERRAYDYAAETTVYVHHEFLGRGIGKALYIKLIETLEKSRITVLLGGIALPNKSSVKLHESLGFQKAGIFKNVGRKNRMWIDVGFWELEIKRMPEFEPENDGV
jgi:phosphinothricin acetyltransferase